MRLRRTSPEPTAEGKRASSVVLGPVEEPGRLRRAGRTTAHVLSRRLLLPTVAAVLALSLAVVGWLNYRDADTEDATAEALREVPAALEKLLTYTPADVERGLQERLELTAGDFRDEYASKVRSVTAPAAIEQKLSARATAVASGVIDEGTDSVRILIAVNVALSTPDAANPVVEGSRVAVTAVKRDGTWKISALDLLNPL